MSDTDPVEDAAAADRDLYDVATWEPRTVLDRVAVALYGALAGGARLFIVVLAALVFLVQVGGVVWLASQRPTLGAVGLLSALPAFVLVALVWRQDIVEKEPLDTLAITFVLAVLFASFAATANTLLGGVFQSIPVIGLGLFFFIVVAPVEETVKWLAIRLYAYRRPEFDAVIDGAVYGAVAGLGFATIENMLYVVQGFLRAQEAGSTQAIGAALGTATSRALAGPGHVIYSAWAGYYLGLAKFNRENRGPIVVKGLLVAVLIHATYNTVVTYAPMASLPGWWYLVFVVGFDGLFLYLLYRKLARYRDSYTDTVVESGDEEASRVSVNGKRREDIVAGAAVTDETPVGTKRTAEGVGGTEGPEKATERRVMEDAESEDDGQGDATKSDEDSGAIWDVPDSEE